MTTSISTRVLDTLTAVRLAQIINAARMGTTVRRYREDSDHVYGQARQLVRGADNLVPPGAGDDVRDAVLRVTTRTGSDHYWPVAELLADMDRTWFVIDCKIHARQASCP